MDLISREAVKAKAQTITEWTWQRGKFIGLADVDSLPSAFEGKTNGEVLKTLFPNMKVHEYTEKVVLNGLGDEFQIQSMAWKNWWNAPYKGGE